ncbi:24563_t:CDS:2 [Cetraspora pellucida]|uniref:24563_t:CDS:1 n=1 Tax=Cetraspora pellucida TaxID=1433469 RepID=A0A9N9FXG2_9GLOM|nr:24563_t:CDS:2 [Cetraspora pellucida]
MLYLPNSNPNKSNNQCDESWTSNIEQKEKSVGKDKQKATSFISENNKIKNSKTHAENTTSIPIPKHNSPLIEANHKDTNNETSAANYDQDITIELLDCNKENKTKKKEFILSFQKKTTYDQDITMKPLDCNKENKTEEKEFILVISKKNNQKENKKKTLTTKANHKDTNNETSAANYDQDITIELLDCNKENKTKKKEFILLFQKRTTYDQDITMEPLDCNKENKTEEKEFILVTSKKNSQKENKKKTLTTSEKSNKSRTENV